MTQGRDVPNTPASILSREVKSLDCLEFTRFRESGIASEYESNSDDSDDRENEGEDDEDEDEEMEIFGWGTDGETLRLLNALNKQGAPDCLGDEIAIWGFFCFDENSFIPVLFTSNFCTANILWTNLCQVRTIIYMRFV